MKLSILIPTIKKHQPLLLVLLQELSRQIEPYLVEILIDDNEFDTTGTKRNRLLDMATGEYVAFFDSDDSPSANYIELLMEGINKGVDCCSLMGNYTVDGNFDGVFEHSIKYSEWKTTENGVKYERFPNHLNCIKSTIAKQFRFPEKNFGEDFDWSTQVHKSGLIKTEHYIPEIIYYYNYISK